MRKDVDSKVSQVAARQGKVRAGELVVRQQNIEGVVRCCGV